MAGQKYSAEQAWEVTSEIIDMHLAAMTRHPRCQHLSLADKAVLLARFLVDEVGDEKTIAGIAAVAMMRLSWHEPAVVGGGEQQ